MIAEENTSPNFIAYDGEGQDYQGDHKLVMLSNSLGESLIDNSRKGEYGWRDWIKFLTKYPNAKNVWYAFGYDVNMIFKDLDDENKIKIFKESKRTKIDDYTIKYLPRKILHINYKKHTFTHYDVFGFFQTSFLKTLKAWNIDAPHIIEQGKAARVDFSKQNIDFMQKYNIAECEKLVEVMTKLNTCINTAKIPPLRAWHGAGAIASRFLDSWNVVSHQTDLAPTPQLQELFNARKFAYFGGRSELFVRGLVDQPIYHYDINSAYPSATRFLPSLHNKTWHYITKEKELKEDDFGLIACSWNWDYSLRVGALPFRKNNNAVIFSQNGKGWYHNIEYQTAKKRGYKIKFLGAWILDRPYEYFLDKPISSMAQFRMELKKNKDLGNIPIKLGLNSLYGKLAQRPIKRDDETYQYGKYADLFFAGFITAHTRAQILRSIDFENIIMIATDGIFSKTPLDVPIGENLGEWEFNKHEKGIFLQAGLYALQDNKEWRVKKRGYAVLDTNDFMKCYKKLQQQENYPYLERRFITIKLASTSELYNECNFQDIERIIDWNNNQKRYFISIEAPTSDSLAVRRPQDQPFSKMYNPKGDKESSEFTDPIIEFSIPHDEI